MHTTVRQCLAAYVRELAAYKKFVDGLKARYGTNVDPLKLDQPHYAQALEWNARLKGMVRLLDLSPEEERRLDREAGLA